MCLAAAYPPRPCTAVVKPVAVSWQDTWSRMEGRPGAVRRRLALTPSWACAPGRALREELLSRSTSVSTRGTDRVPRTTLPPSGSVGLRRCSVSLSIRGRTGPSRERRLQGWASSLARGVPVPWLGRRGPAGTMIIFEGSSLAAMWCAFGHPPPVKAPPEGPKFGDVAICQYDRLAGAGSPPASGNFAVRRGGVRKFAPHEVFLVAKLADKRGPHLGKACGDRWRGRR